MRVPTVHHLHTPRTSRINARNCSISFRACEETSKRLESDGCGTTRRGSGHPGVGSQKGLETRSERGDLCGSLARRKAALESGSGGAVYSAPRKPSTIAPQVTV